MLVRHHVAIVNGLAVLPEDREVDPREIVTEPRAPDHVRDVEDAPVVEHGCPVPDADRPRHAFDPGRDHVLRLHADERAALRRGLRADLPADRRPQGQHMVADESHDADEDEPGHRG